MIFHISNVVFIKRFAHVICRRQFSVLGMVKVDQHASVHSTLSPIAFAVANEDIAFTNITVQDAMVVQLLMVCYR